MKKYKNDVFKIVKVAKYQEFKDVFKILEEMYKKQISTIDENLKNFDKTIKTKDFKDHYGVCLKSRMSRYKENVKNKNVSEKEIKKIEKRMKSCNSAEFKEFVKACREDLKLYREEVNEKVKVLTDCEKNLLEIRKNATEIVNMKEEKDFLNKIKKNVKN